MTKTFKKPLAAVLLAGAAALTFAGAAEAGGRYGHHGYRHYAPAPAYGVPHRGPAYRAAHRQVVQNWYNYHAYHEAVRHQRRHDNNTAIAVGVAGLALGAAIAQPQYAPPSRAYYGPVTAAPAYPPDYYAPGYGAASYQDPSDRYASSSRGGEWVGSADWYSYCQGRYKTFDPASGTFMSNSGVRKLCR